MKRVTPATTNVMNGPQKNSQPDPLIEAYKKDVDRTLIRENLKLSIEERFQKLMRLQEFARELKRSRQQESSS